MAAGKPEEGLGEEAGRTDLDAVGNDKRRQVVGQQYGDSARKRLLFYGISVLVIVLAIVVFLTVIRGIDDRDIPLRDTAPWAAEDAPQIPPRDIDFMRNGPGNTIPEDQIVSR
jgi:hypothetical protein